MGRQVVGVLELAGWTASTLTAINRRRYHRRS
jgi:hypothetical protein